MGSFFSSNSGSNSTTSDDSTTKQTPISIWDPSAVKSTLDEAVCKFIESKELNEDVTFSNIKLALGVSACLIAFGTQLLNIYTYQKLVLTLVVAYFILHGIMQFVALLLNPFTLMITRAKYSTVGGKKQLTHQPITIKSHLTRFETDYHLVWEESKSTKEQFSFQNVKLFIKFSLTSKPEKFLIDDKSSKPHRLSTALNITDYFDVKGTFLKDKFNAKMEQLYLQFSEGGEKKK